MFVAAIVVAARERSAVRPLRWNPLETGIAAQLQTPSSAVPAGPPVAPMSIASAPIDSRPVASEQPGPVLPRILAVVRLRRSLAAALSIAGHPAGRSTAMVRLRRKLLRVLRNPALDQQVFRRAKVDSSIAAWVSSFVMNFSSSERPYWYITKSCHKRQKQNQMDGCLISRRPERG